MVDITHLVFDLGGVVVELRGKPVKPEWFPAGSAPDDVWKCWLQSVAPRAFEAGKIDKETFARSVVDELSLTVEAAEYLDYFSTLPIGPFPGVVNLLSEVRKRYKTALFSNSNEVHWERKSNEMNLVELFDHHFASHLMGCVKPDREAFEYVISALAVPAPQILFFDDNQLNVDAARYTGMQADKVVGPEELRTALVERGICFNGCS